jgi:hypothetical protein
MPKPELRKFLSAAFGKQLPQSIQEIIENMHHLHLCFFFLWGRYYELIRRLFRIRYHISSNSNGANSYLRAGRFIMVQILIKLGIFIAKSISALIDARNTYKAKL